MTAADILKAWKTAQAECLLAGFAAHLVEDDRGRPMLIVSLHSLTRSFASAESVRSWLREVAQSAVVA